MPTLDEQIRNAKKRRILEKAKFETARYKAGYEILDDRDRRKRRRSKIEIGGEDRQAKPGDRLKMVNYSRDLWRNFSQAKGMIKQLHLNIVGPGPLVTFTTDDKEWNKKAERWFNIKWAKRSDATGRRHFGQQMKIAYIHSIIDGDVLGWFDVPTGKLWWREADQMPTITAASWEKSAKGDKRFIDRSQAAPPGKQTTMMQMDGLVFDLMGMVHWYVVHSKHGAVQADFNDVTFIDANVAMLLSNPWRFSQRRGWSELATSGAELWDIKEMREHELQSAKVASAWAMQITREDAEEVQKARSDRPEVGEIDDSQDATEHQYESFEKITGGALEYMNAGEEAKVLDNPRPSSNVEPFFNHVAGSAGHSLALPKLFSLLRADGSYSASRAELNIADTTFGDGQIHMARNLYDPILTMAIPWAMSNNQLDEIDDWEDRWTWKHPRLQPIDATREAKAVKEKMRGGLLDLSDILGPDWRGKLESLSEQKKAAEELQLTLDVFPSEKVAQRSASSSAEQTAEAVAEQLRQDQDE